MIKYSFSRHQGLLRETLMGDGAVQNFLDGPGSEA